jgi:hypothetical protein
MFCFWFDCYFIHCIPVLGEITESQKTVEKSKQKSPHHQGKMHRIISFPIALYGESKKELFVKSAPRAAS